MKKRRCWRYYCEHCGKGGCSAGHMSTHEKHCTHNPERICRMCGETRGDNSALAVALSVQGMDWLRKAVEDCPACILAVIHRHAKMVKHTEPKWWQEFDYKSEVQAWWRSKNAMESQGQGAPF